MPLTLADLEYLTGPDARELLAGDLPDDPLVARRRLRGRCTPAQARAIVTLRSLRRRAAAAKFPPDWAERLLLTDALLQQASSLRIAAYKARRLRTWAGEGPLFDLCCGLGADALGAAAHGGAVRGYDRSAVAVFCARHNARAMGLADRCRFEQADVTTRDLPAQAVVHVDPDRRAGGRRAIAWDHYSPPAAFLRGLPGRTRAGCVKLSPAMDTAALADWSGVALEYVSEGGVCRQLLAWWPGQASAQAGPPTRATVLAGDFV